MFYNSILLHQDHWKYQKILINPDFDPDSKALIAIIITLIYGVRPVGNQCEEGIKLLAMEVCEKFPLVANLMLVKRYMDDLGYSTKNDESTDRVIKETTDVLRLVSMKVKGWVRSGADPPEELSDNGISVSFAGMIWFPCLDVYKLNIDSLLFGKKRRGRYPPDMVKFEDTVVKTID